MNKHILVIDDEEDIRNSVSLALKDTEYQVDTAETGEEGVKKERSKKYDLIFLDLKMPGMGGAKALQEIRKENKETLIYIMTAFYKEFCEELKTYEKEGIAYELIKKPIDSNKILLLTKSILEGPIIQ